MHKRSLAIPGKQTAVIILGFMVLKLLFHLPFNGRYGYHSDELLYIAMADQPAWGYKEGPPLIAFITRIVLQINEDSLWFLRLLPTLCGAALVGLTGLITRQLGGGPLAVLIGCTAISLDPSFLATGYMMQPVIFDQISWTLSCFFLLRFIKTGNRQMLVYLGITAGLGMMNKFTIAAYLLSLFMALVFTNRQKLSLKDLLLISFPALMIVFPHVLWQFANDYPFLEQMGELEKYYWSKTDYPTLIKQLLFSHGASGIVCLAGLIFICCSERMRPYRFLGIGFLILLLVFLFVRAKTYYSFGAFPVLYSAGAVFIAQLMDDWRKSFVNAAFFTTIILSGLLAMPAVIPVLPLHHTVAWLDIMKRHTGIVGPLQWNDGTTRTIPQYFAQMLGWEQLAAQTLNVYRSLPESKRASALILTENYQQAGAIAFYGKDEVPATVSLRPSFFAHRKDLQKSAEYMILVTSEANPKGPRVAGLVRAQQIDYPNAEVNGSVIYLVRRKGPML